MPSEPIPEALPGGNTLWQQSGVNPKGEPFVQLIMGTRVIAQMSVEDARDYGRNMIEIAEAAEQDAFIFDWVVNVVGAGDVQAAGLLNDFRKHRLKRTGKRSGMEVIPTDPPPTAKRRLMAEEWESFSRSVFDNETPDLQRKEMRRAFYAGGQGIMFKIIQALAPESEPTEADLQMMWDLYEELQEFSKMVEKGARMKKPDKKTFEELLNEGPARDFLFRAEQEMLPKMEQSAMSLVIGADRPDIKLCLEVGAAILFDKPLIVMLPPGGAIPQRLRDVATVVLDDFDYTHPDAQDRLKQAIENVKDLIHK